MPDAEAVEVPDEQDAPVRERVRAGVLVAGARVEVEEEQERREDAVQANQALQRVAADGRRPGNERVDDLGPVAGHA